VSRDATERLRPWLDRKEILAICGMRRSGKSTLMRQLLSRLVESGVSPDETLFVNFEDPVFLDRPLDVATLDRVFDTFFELGRPSPSAVPRLFLDEIHNVAGWSRWVRARVESGRAQITVTGSSAQLLEPDVATVLTGRNITWTLWPLSFRELLRFRGAPIDATAMPAPARIRQELARYIRYGGLPEVALAEDAQVQVALLKQYFRDILYRDVVSRHQIRDVRALERVAHHYLVNTGNLSTFNRLKNSYGLAMDQVRSYTAFLEQCYMIRQVDRYSPKVSSQSRLPRKVYAADTGVRNAVAFRFSEDIGRLAETVVHNQLVRDPDVRVFYFAGAGECDFVVWSGDRPVRAIQVCYEADRLPEREVSGVIEAMAAVGAMEGLILTDSLEQEIDSGGKRIRVRPLWRWLCEAAA
jgi:hypothetical protein